MPHHINNEALRKYCCNRKLNRPETNAAAAARYLFALQIITTLLALGLSYLLRGFGIAVGDWVLHLLSNTVLIAVFSKRICVTSVELYQHYAPERIRRRCTLVPSCSEYTLLALQKYGTVIGVYKAYNRVFKKCVGGVYTVDYP